MATVERFKADILSISPTSEQIEELREKMELRYWWEHGNKKNKNKKKPKNKQVDIYTCKNRLYLHQEAGQEILLPATYNKFDLKNQNIKSHTKSFTYSYFAVC